jgi:hypothetical protein
MCTADDCWLWARWMTMEYMCALVCNTFFSFSFKQYRFRGLSWRISVEEKKINTLRCSKDFEDLQQCWWTKSLMKIVESSVLFGQEVKILCSQSVLYILPFSRRNSTRIAFFFVGNPTPSFGLLLYYRSLAQVAGLFSMRIRWRFFPRVSSFGHALQMIWLSFDELQTCPVPRMMIGVYRWRLPVFYRCHLDGSPLGYRYGLPRLPFWSSIVRIPSLPSFRLIFHVHV